MGVGNRVCTRKKKRNSVVTYYKIHDHCVDQVEEAKYLGVALDKKITFNLNSIFKKS